METYLGVSSSETNDSLETSCCYRQGTFVLSASHLGISTGNELSSSFRKDGVDPCLGKVQILAQEVVLEDVVGVRIGIVGRCLVRSSCSLPHRVRLGAFGCCNLIVIVVVVITVVAGLSEARSVSVSANDVAGNSSIAAGVQLIQNHEEQIETRKEGVGKANVLLNAPTAIVLAIDGVGSGQDRAAGIETGVDASLGNGNGLLLHGLVDSDTVVLAHLVELIDADQTTVGQHHGTSLQTTLASVGIGGDGSRQTDAGRSLTGGRNGEGGNDHGRTEELTLGRRRITDHEDVDVTTEMGAVVEILLHTRKKLKGQSLLDDLVTVDGGGDTAAEDGKDVVALADGPDGTDILGREVEVADIPAKDLDVVDQDHRLEEAGGGGLTGGRGGRGTVDTDDLNAITGLDPVDEVVVQDQLDGTGELSHGGTLGHLLQGDGLVVLEGGQSELGLELVALLVLGGVDAGGDVDDTIGQLSAGGVDGRETQLRVGGIDVLPGLVLLGGRAVVYRTGHLGLDRGNLGGHTLNADQLPKRGGGELPRTGGGIAHGTSDCNLDLHVCIEKWIGVNMLEHEHEYSHTITSYVSLLHGQDMTYIIDSLSLSYPGRSSAAMAWHAASRARMCRRGS